MTAPTCQTCGQPIPSCVRDSYTAWQRRKFCNMDCRRGCSNRSRCTITYTATAGRLEEVERLLAIGLQPHQVAAELGLSARSLGRWLQRHGRPDLARPFYRIDWHERAAA